MKQILDAQWTDGSTDFTMIRFLSVYVYKYTQLIVNIEKIALII